PQVCRDPAGKRPHSRNVRRASNGRCDYRLAEKGLEWIVGTSPASDLEGKTSVAGVNGWSKVMGISVRAQVSEGGACRKGSVKAVIRCNVSLDCVHSGKNQACKTRFLNVPLIIGDSNRSQDADDRHDDHKFHQCKTFALSHLDKHVLLLVG